MQAELTHKTTKLLHLLKNKAKKTSFQIFARFSKEKIISMFTTLDYVNNIPMYQNHSKNNFFNLLTNPCYLFYCYTLLNKIKTISKIGTNKKILESILILNNQVRTKTYYFSFTYYILANKKNKKLATIKISSITNQIIQKALFLILDIIFKKSLNNYSQFNLNNITYSLYNFQ